MKGPTLDLTLFVGSREKRGKSPLVTASLELRSEALPLVEVFVMHRGRGGHFAAEDGKVTHAGLRLKPPANLDAVPAWFAEVARRLQVRWAEPGPVTTNLRGGARARLLTWLLP